MNHGDSLPAKDAGTSLTAWLRAVLWGAFLVPTAAFALTAWWGYERAYKEAVDTVQHASALALAHAERSLDVAADIARRVDGVASGSDDEVRLGEAAIHQRLSDLAAGLPSVVNVNIWDATGHALARSDLYPVDARASVADRAYFIEQRTPGQALGISEVITGRQTGQELMNVSVRRQAADGSFKGVVAVSLSPGYFRDYYRSLAAEQPNLASFALIRADGALLARWPPPPDGRSHVDPDNDAFHRLFAGRPSGVVTLDSKENGQTRLVSFRRVDGYPIYVTAGVARSGMLAGWARFVSLVAAVLVPTTLGLVYVSWVALRKTRREQAMALELREEIRRRASAEQALMETQKFEALSQLTGGVAHDFNNLLAVVNISLNVFKRKHAALKEDRQLEAMGRAIKSGVRLTRQLLSFSRKQALRPETVDLQQWLPATEDLVRSTLGRNIDLQFQVEPDTLPITVDLAELELALINTALNAQHAMPDGGALRVTASNAAPATVGGAPMVMIGIADDGAGIPPELLNKVFEPFFTTKGPGKGTGLGLSQVHGLCAQSGGFATVASTPGRGTSIGMYFPSAVREVSPSEATQSEQPGPLSGRVLLVEDNDEVAGVTESLLRAAGLEVTRVPHADAAMATLAGAPQPDLVFSDISMPGSMDGIGLAFAVGRHWPDLPVLLTTGYAERIDEAIAAGFRVLTKPVPPEEVLGEIGAILGRRAAAEPAGEQVV